MNRMGQVLIAAITAGGACVGGAAALTTVTGISPAQLVQASPAATFQAIGDATRTAAVQPNGTPSPAATILAAVRTSIPRTHATTGASGAQTTANGTAKAAAGKAPITHATSGASGAAVANGQGGYEERGESEEFEGSEGDDD